MKAVVRRMPGCTDFGPLDGISAEIPPMSEISGVTYYSAQSWQNGVSHCANGGKAIILCMALGDTGLMQGLTVEGARRMAASLMKLADRLDAEAAGEVAAALDNIRAQRGKS
ncbi:hypothetical protein [Novosphingobium sp. BL-52-GroH]|uniref:hypothetical protein n=1 Tax=Novosphingobium sp. BL-52-GroH TaxID=3349877 RepID=UPI00385176DC